MDVGEIPPVVMNFDVPAFGGAVQGMLRVDDRANEQGFPAPDDFHYFPLFVGTGRKAVYGHTEGDGGAPEGKPAVGGAFGDVQEFAAGNVKGFHRGLPRVKL